ncbi:4'-phosphopantetheinyl transferase family protein [Chitinophaga vietnamensis]|uniref:4'-phosphopantetheinyl transferase family protein n=1 Tax=Chitinophaga vietnamensis TaxID=2593957 RepID=UPI0011778A87|nr:hypothetical protein [Chitinophaga vietnamensis]
MITIYVSDTLPEMPEKKWLLIKRFFNDKILDRLEKSPGDTYRLRRFTSRLMLIQIFEDLGISLQHLGSLCYNSFGKLVVKPLTYNISISYSGDKTVCLVSDDRAGLDVEDIQKEPGPRHVNLLEQLTATIIKDRIDFYCLWTKMESIAKIYEDKGLAAVIYDPEAREKHYTQQFLLQQKYMISVAATKAFDIAVPIKLLHV